LVATVGYIEPALVAYLYLFEEIASGMPSWLWSLLYRTVDQLADSGYA
tara:strand:- start:94 stop:237 length:144 start_codon:yes stop_codon:yes gene_type:complete